MSLCDGLRAGFLRAFYVLTAAITRDIVRKQFNRRDRNAENFSGGDRGGRMFFGAASSPLHMGNSPGRPAMSASNIYSRLYALPVEIRSVIEALGRS